MVTYAEDNPFPYATFVETVDPANPAAGIQLLFVDTDHLLKLRDSSGTVTTYGTGLADPMTTRGDIIVRDAANATARLAIGSSGKVLSSDGTDVSWQTPSAGAMATDALWDAAGDLAQGTGANTGAKLTLGAAGTVVRSTGATNAYAYPPGYEIDYAERTSLITINTTSEGGAQTVITSNSVTYENVPYMVELFTPRVNANAGIIVHDLYVDSTVLGRIGLTDGAATAQRMARRYTPTAAAHTFTWKAWRVTADGDIYGNSGGTGTELPAFIRITKV